MNKLRGIFYGWVLVGVSAFIMVIGTVPLFQGMSVWFVVLEGHFGWSRTQLSFAFSLSRIEGSITGPLSGYLIERLGPRRLVAIGLLIAGAGFVLMSQMQTLWHFYVAFAVISVGVGLGTWMPMMTVLNSWFNRRRSMAMALAMEGFQIGGVLMIPLLAWAVDPDIPGRLGWRNTSLILGLFLLVAALPVSRMVRNTPEEYGEHPDGQQPRVGRAGGADDGPSYTWQEAVRTKAFWLIAMGHALTSTVIITMMVHLGPMLTDRGQSLQTVGFVVATYTAVGAIFTLIGGYAGDRAPIRWAIFIFSSFQSLAVVLLLLNDSLLMAYLFGVTMGIGHGAKSPLTTAVRGVYFGRKAFASITGISMIPMNFLLFGTPLFAGYMYDRTDSYVIPMVVVAALNFIGSGLFIFLGPPGASGSAAAVPGATGSTLGTTGGTTGRPATAGAAITAEPRPAAPGGETRSPA